MFIKCHYLSVLGGTTSPGSRPVPAHCFLARNGVWYWDRSTEEDTGLYCDSTPQFSIVFPADKRVFTSSGELQQGELQDPDDAPYLNPI